MIELALLLALFAPLTGLLWLAQMADRPRQQVGRSPLSVLSYALLLAMWAGSFVGGLLLLALGVFFQQTHMAVSLDQSLTQSGLPANAGLQLLLSFVSIGAGLSLLALVGMVLLLPAVRRLLSRFIPIDPARATHTVALAFAVLVLMNLWLTLGIGLEQLADWVSTGSAMATGELINYTWAQELIFALMGLIGVGWLSRRDWRQAWQRLGVVRPHRRDLLVGIGTALGLVVLLFLLEWALNRVGLTLEGDENVSRLSEQLIGPMSNSWLGVITLGLAAALGEETIFRGALQPRFGLLLTSVLFALLHSTYGLTLSTLIVLLLGLILGWLRQRYNTSTSMAMHATYNMLLGLASMLALWPQ